MYMQPTLFPLLDRVMNTSVVSSSLCVYWNSALSVKWSFHLPSVTPVTEVPLLDRCPVPTGVLEPPSRSGRNVYVGSGGRKASLAAIWLGQGGQQKRQQSSPRERPFILHCVEGQEDYCVHHLSVHTKGHFLMKCTWHLGQRQNNSSNERFVQMP